MTEKLILEYYLLTSETNPNYSIKVKIDYWDGTFSLLKVDSERPTPTCDFTWKNTKNDTSALAYLIGDAIKFALDKIKKYQEKIVGEVK